MVILRRQLWLILFLILGALGAVIAAAWMLLAIIFNPLGQRGWVIAVAFDQLFNAASGGDEDETLSERAARLRKDGVRWACVLCRLLNWLDDGHCRKK